MIIQLQVKFYHQIMMICQSQPIIALSHHQVPLSPIRDRPGRALARRYLRKLSFVKDMHILTEISPLNLFYNKALKLRL